MTATLAEWLLAATLKGSLLLAIALVISLVARNRMPSRWLSALLLVAVVRLLLPVAPAAPFSAFNLLRGESAHAPRIAVGAAPALLMRAQMPRSQPAAMVPSSTWTVPFLVLWFAGVLLLSVRVIVRTFTFQWSLRHARVITTPEVLHLIDEGRDALRVHRRVRVLESNAVTTPSLHGWLQPAMLLPEGFLSSFRVEQVRYVVLHELAHVRRYDVLVNWVVTAAQVLHWFNPLVPLAAARLSEERELACDALALAALGHDERAAYGDTVLELVDRLQPGAPAPAVVGMTTTKRQLHRRIRMIATYRKSRYSLVFGAVVLAIGLVTLTDATAGESRMFRRVRSEPLSAAAQATADKLEQSMTAEFASASVDQIVHAVSNATGAVIQYDDGALDDEARAMRLSIKATNVPAHMVLAETLASANLVVRVTDAGVLVEKTPAGETMLPRQSSPNPATEVEGDRTIVLSFDESPRESQSMTMERTEQPGRRTIRFKGQDENTGVLELEILRKQ